MKAGVKKKDGVYPPPTHTHTHTHSCWAKWAGLSAPWQQSREAHEALSGFHRSVSLPAPAWRSRSEATRQHPQAHLQLAPWRGTPRISWPRTGPRERSSESTGWRSRSPPRRSCRRRGRVTQQRDEVKAREEGKERVRRTDVDKKVEEDSLKRGEWERVQVGGVIQNDNVSCFNVIVMKSYAETLWYTTVCW